MILTVLLIPVNKYIYRKKAAYAYSLPVYLGMNPIFLCIFLSVLFAAREAFSAPFL